jgi:hypothetical protein
VLKEGQIIKERRKNSGFTLMELLLALTAGVLVLGTTMGIYRHVVRGEEDLRSRHTGHTRRMQISGLLNGLLLKSSGPVYGDEDRLAIISDMNVLGYGREVIYMESLVKEKLPHLVLRIVPQAFSPELFEEETVERLYNDPDLAVEYSYGEELAGFSSVFSFRVGGEELEEVSGEEPDLIKIVIREDDGDAWVVARSWQ